MKIGLVLTKHVSRITGPYSYAVSLWKNLIKVNKYHKLNCFVPRNTDSKDGHEDTVVLISRLPIIRWKSMRKYDLDIIHFSQGMPLSLVGFVDILFCPPSKTIATVHGDLHWVLPEYVMNAGRLTILKRRHLERLVSKRFDYFIAVSESVKRSIIKYSNVPEDRIKVIYEGVDTDLFRVIKQEEKDSFKKEMGIEYPYILYVSNYAPVKNVHTLVNAYAELRKKGIQHKLLIVGERWGQSDIYNLIGKLGIEKEVNFLGFIPPKGLVPLYNCADLFVTPSLHETFGLPILEAMACGCPVIAGNVYAMPEVVGDAALLLDNSKDTSELCHKIHELLTDENLRAQLRIKGLARVQQFSWGKCAEETLKLYEKVYKLESRSFKKELLLSLIRFPKRMAKRYYIKLFKANVNEDFYNKAHQRKRLQWLKENSKGRILEIGCSTGYTLNYVNGDTGIDIDKERLERARKLRPHLAFQYADACNLPFRDKEFDTAMVPEVLEHVPYEKAKEIVKEATRVGKQVLITIPRQEKYLRNPEHLWIPTDISILESFLKGYSYSVNSEIEDYFLVKITGENKRASA
jgi:glycosyltransferase involved in cell wall biosynthesis